VFIVYTLEMTENLFTLTRQVSDFTAENCEGIRGVRAKSINLHILLVWIGRHVVFDHYRNSQWFGGSQEKDNFVFWFKLEKDRDKCEKFFEEIFKFGVPKHKYFE
jgi:hypothetical protein